jgi:hypothetical protein
VRLAFFIATFSSIARLKENYKMLMKKILLVALLVLSLPSFGQTSLDEVISKAESLISSGSTKGLVEVLGSASKAMQSELNLADAQSKSQLLSQADALKALVPAALSGKADLNAFKGIFNKIKLILSANRLRSVLSDGRGSLAGNAPKITRALNLMQSGASGLNSPGLQKGIDTALKGAGKLDKGGLFKNCRAKKTEKQLTKLVSLASELI